MRENFVDIEFDNAERLIEPQNGNCFPGTSDKKIDYVIYYENTYDIAISEVRERFIKKLGVEGFDVDYLEHSEKNEVFVLLHCTINRLMEEAERIKLKCNLDKEKFGKIKVRNEESCLNSIRRILYTDTKPNDFSPQVPFESKISQIFDEFNQDPQKFKGFSPAIRCLLVDNMLSNLRFNIEQEDNHEQETIQEILARILSEVEPSNVSKEIEKNYEHSNSLKQMLKKNYFKSTFILHDASRSYLNESWSKWSYLFKFQPLNAIREYFDEYIGFYFSWCENLIVSLLLVSFIGILFSLSGFVYGLTSLPKKWRTTFLGQNSTRFQVMLNEFAESIDNPAAVAYPAIICIWAIYVFYKWKHKSKRLEFEWGVNDFRLFEVERIEYKCRKKVDRESYQKLLKYFCSITILLLMIAIIALSLGFFQVLRIYLKKSVPKKYYTQIQVFIDIGVTILHTVFCVLMSKINRFIALRLTNWENPRTRSKYNNLLVLKLFAFEFVNNYGPLLFVGHVGIQHYENGFFNLGKDYHNRCDDTCLTLLTIYVYVFLIIQPLPKYLMNTLWPFISAKCYPLRENDSEISFTQAEKIVFECVSRELVKPKLDFYISDSYLEKVIMYGYVVIFAASYAYLSPFIFFIYLIVDLRADSKRFLLLYQRPVPVKAKNIGIFKSLISFINIFAVINNGLLIAFSTNYYRQTKTQEDRLKFLNLFENILFLCWLITKLVYAHFTRERKTYLTKQLAIANEIVMSTKAIHKQLEMNHNL